MVVCHNDRIIFGTGSVFVFEDPENKQDSRVPEGQEVDWEYATKELNDVLNKEKDEEAKRQKEEDDAKLKEMQAKFEEENKVKEEEMKRQREEYEQRMRDLEAQIAKEGEEDAK